MKNVFSRGLMVYVTRCIVIQSMQLAWDRATSRQSEGLFRSWPNGICHALHCNPIHASCVGSLRARVGVFFSRGLMVSVTRCLVIQSMQLAWVRPRSRARVMRDFFSRGLVVYVTRCILIQLMQPAWV